MKHQKGNILIVDDSPEILIALSLLLEEHFPNVDTLSNPNQIPEYFKKSSYDIVLLDMNFSAGINSGNEGLYWMKQILDLDQDAIVVLMTAFAEIDIAIRGIKEGANDFIEKPWDDDKLLAIVSNGIKLKRSHQEITDLKNKQKHLSASIDKKYDFVQGKSQAMQNILTQIQKVSATDANVLITGENGTGKELIAREIHRQSNRASSVFISVDMASLTDTLFESELFGHVKGAFTGANESRAGRFEIASGGTLFLDEIGNVSLDKQTKLLQVIQERVITRVGSNKITPIDIRLISATNKPLKEMTQENKFREDLLYRINTIQLECPPLRERTEDIQPIADYYLNKYSQKYNRPALSISESAIEVLKQHRWSGNVRELQHAVEKAVILSEGNLLDADSFIFEQDEQPNSLRLRSLNLAENEEVIIRDALKIHKGNISEAARALGITRKTLYNKLEKYEV